MNQSARLAAALSLALLAPACAPIYGPPPPGRFQPPPPPPPPARATVFNAAEFAWAKAPGRNGVVGKLTYREGPTRFSCAGAGVVLTPETAWSRRRMLILYGSMERAALPTSAVRARTANAPPGDPGPFVRRTTCDSADRFSFSGLPDGAWYVIVLARPLGQPRAEGTAMMRRVTTRGGRITNADL